MGSFIHSTRGTMSEMYVGENWAFFSSSHTDYVICLPSFKINFYAYVTFQYKSKLLLGMLFL
jgi:hypothetical protein